MPSSNSRTSMQPSFVVGCAAATATAASRSGHSTTSYPAICSLVSANGPSVTTLRPSLTRTVVASVVGRSRAPSSTTPRAVISLIHSVSSSSTEAGSGSVSALWSTACSNAYFTANSSSRCAGADRRPSPRGRTARAGSGHLPKDFSKNPSPAQRTGVGRAVAPLGVDADLRRVVGRRGWGLPGRGRLASGGLLRRLLRGLRRGRLRLGRLRLGRLARLRGTTRRGGRGLLVVLGPLLD